MMKKKGLAKRKMRAEKRLGKSLKVPMVKRTNYGCGAATLGYVNNAFTCIKPTPARPQELPGRWMAIPADDDAAAATDAATAAMLDELNAEIAEFEDAEAAAAKFEDEFAAAAAKAVTTTDEECVYLEECDEDGDCFKQEECWYDDDDWQEKAGDWLMETVISYGFDPDVAEEWLEGKQETWAEIEARQREEKANQLAQDITELADESSKIFENMLDDLTSRFPDLTAMLAEELNDLADDALDEIQRAKNETQAMIEDFVADLSSNDIELKQMGETQAAANNGAYGYAALALGVAAVIAYSIRRRAINKTSGINEPLIDD